MRLSRFLPAVAAVVFLSACDLSTEPNVPSPVDPAVDTYATSLGVNIASMTKTASGLYYKDKTVGAGDVVAAVNDSIKADYILWLTNGTKVDSSIDNGTPIEFRIGDTDVIPGFSEGFIGMKPGGVRQLVIPTQLAWGSQGSVVPGKVPVQPNANVVFEIHFLSKF
jgi:FKBP-type peptidyl-prolyl cis-trans isomerase